MHIEALKDEIFYATVKIRNGNNTFELDARPSDALTLAVYLDIPIYIAEEVLNQVGISLPEGQVLLPPANDAQYREEFLRNLEEMIRLPGTNGALAKHDRRRTRRGKTQAYRFLEGIS